MSIQLNLSAHASELKEAYKEVISKESSINWIVLGYSKGTNDLKVVGKGEDGLEELEEEFEDDKILFALTRVTDPNSNLPKLCGEGAPIKRKGLLPTHLNDVQSFFSGYHIQINARDSEDITPENIMKKVEEGSGAKYSYQEMPRSVSTPPKAKAFTPNRVSSNPSPYQRTVQNSATDKPKPPATPVNKSPSQPQPVQSRFQDQVSLADKEKNDREEQERFERQFLQKAGQSSSHRPSNSTSSRKAQEDSHQSVLERLELARSKREQGITDVNSPPTSAPKQATRDIAKMFEQNQDQVLSNQFESAKQQLRYNNSPSVPDRPISSGDETKAREDKIRAEIEEAKRKEEEHQRALEEENRLKEEHKRELEEAARLEEEESQRELEEAQYKEEQKIQERKAEEKEMRALQEQKERELEEERYRKEQEERELEEERYRKEQEERELEEERYRKEKEERELEEEEERQREILAQDVARMKFEEEQVKAAPSQEGQADTLTAIALFDYAASDDTEINLREGEMIINIVQIDEGWWQGDNESGETGVFPANYVEVVENHMPQEPQQEEVAQAESHAESGAFAIALFDYDASEEGELSFGAADKITNLEFLSDDWWQGSNPAGQVGLFPANYVELQQS